jgi:cytochrome c553
MAGPRSLITASLCLAAAGLVPAARAADHPGRAIYLAHCARCHGVDGRGTTDLPDPLAGDLSVNQLAALVDETMPEDDPTQVTGDAARQVAEYMHEAFYSAVARDRNRPARVELSRLTVRQHRTVVADLLGGFRGAEPPLDDQRGLRGEYFHGRRFAPEDLVFARHDPEVDFDFGVEGPDPERFEPNRFAIRWSGAIVPMETGRHEFVIHSEHSVRLFLNDADGERPLVDGYVQSGADAEHRGSIFLLGGRPYPLRLEFAKAHHGVADKSREPFTTASIRLLWKPPHGTLAPVPGRCLIPHDAPPVFVLDTAFPPDDRSLGYERGSAVSPEWFAAATAAAVATADEVLRHADRFAGTRPGAADRAARLQAFAATFAERAWRGPLDAETASLLLARPFADAPDADTGLKRAVLGILCSTRFLFPAGGTTNQKVDPDATAARLALGLWDSLPDATLRAAAARGELATPAQVRTQAERMVADRRTRAKVRDFLLAWLRVDHGPEIVKDQTVHPEWNDAVAADLRTSLLLTLEDVVWHDGDFRRMFTAEETYLNGRLAAVYGANLPPDAPFRRVSLEAARGGGLLSHPYLMSVFSHADATSPIHRGVFLARNVLGNTLRPPADAVAPLPPEQHPDLTTRERVALQTRGVACQTCHTMINPLGFALEEFDAIGRFRTAEDRGGTPRPIDASGSYLPRTGAEATFRGARELAASVASSRDAHEAFVQALFHALVKQPVRAWGPDTLGRLTTAFEAGGFDIRRLVVDIMVEAVFPPSVPPSTAALETTP